MKKKVTILSILGLLFLIAGGALFFFAPWIINAAESTNTMLFVDGQNNMFTKLFPTITTLFQTGATSGGPLALVFWIAVIAGGVMLILAIAHLILIIANKRAGGLPVFFAFLLTTFITFSAIVIMMTPNYFDPVTFGGATLAEDAQGGVFAFVISAMQLKGGLQWYWAVLIFGAVVLLAVGLILMLIAEISDMVYVASSPKAPKRDYALDSASDSNVVLVHDEEAGAPAPTSAEIRQIMQQEMESSSGQKKDAAPVNGPAYGPMPAGITGPLLVQYINTYSPGTEPVRSAQPEKREENPNQVPVSEIQGNIAGDKPLTADDVRKIIQEELAPKQPAQPTPVIVSVPAPAEAPKQPLTAEDIRAIIREELTPVQEEIVDDVVIEDEGAPASGLTADDIRAIIREELGPKEEPVVEEEKPVDIRQIIAEELKNYSNAEKEETRQKEAAEELKRKEEEARRAELEEARAQAAEEARRQYEAALPKKEEPAALTPDDIRQIIAEQFARNEKKEEEPAPEPAPAPAPALTAEDIRSIIRDELKADALREEKVAPTTIYVTEAPREEEPAPAPAPEPAPAPQPAPQPAPTPVIVIQQPAAPAPAPAPVVEEKKAPRKVGEVNPDLPPHDKIVRIPFPTRMLTADKEMQANYNELKSDIIAYGAKSRVSNSGDTFRLHKQTFVKITIAGKSLKLYMALDPKDYANSPLPVDDVSHKNVYKDIPLVFKVKSELSMRRAKQLISDVMDKFGLEQGKVQENNWVKELVDYKPTGSNNDDDD